MEMANHHNQSTDAADTEVELNEVIHEIQSQEGQKSSQPWNIDI